MKRSASQTLYWRITFAVMLTLLPGCAEQEPAGVAERNASSPASLNSPSAKAPIEIGRLATANTGANASQSTTQSAIYTGSGMLYTPGVKTAAGAKSQLEGEVSFDFLNADIKEVAKSVLSDLLGLNYLVDSSVQGTITIQTNQKIPKDDVLPTFESVLRVNGLALVQQGGFYTIVPFGSAGKAGNLNSRDAGYGTEILALQYVSPEQMRRVLEPIIPQGTIVQVDQARNIMVIGGTLGERAAIRQNVASFDVDWLRGMSFALFKPRIATAKQMADDLSHVMGDESSPMAGQVRLVPIERMNAVLAVARQPRYLEELKGWVARLDQGNDTTERRLFVYYVQNGRAVDIARVLGRALGVRTNDSQSSTSQPSITGRSTSLSGLQQGQGFGGFGGQISSQGVGGGQLSTMGSAPTAQSFGAGLSAGSIGNTAPSAGMSSSGASSSNSVNSYNNDQAGGLSVTADDVNNALLILATSAEYDVIDAALKKLDRLPLQVLIEAAIAEVTLTKDLNFGVQWKFNNGTNQATLSGTTSAAISGSYPGFSYLYSSGTRISAVLSALQDLTHVDVLSAPKLMVLNNQTAILQVGDEVPIVTQTAVSNLTSDAPTVNSVQYQATGIILSVTPRVNEDGLVTMDISQEVSDVAATTSSTLNSPTINDRKISSTVAIQDGQTIALGGLISDNRSNGRSGVPYLQNIPVLGQLFREDTSHATRTELIVLITPRVIHDARDAAAITDELKGKLMDLRDDFLPLKSPSTRATTGPSG